MAYMKKRTLHRDALPEEFGIRIPKQDEPAISTFRQNTPFGDTGKKPGQTAGTAGQGAPSGDTGKKPGQNTGSTRQSRQPEDAVREPGRKAAPQKKNSHTGRRIAFLLAALGAGIYALYYIDMRMTREALPSRALYNYYTGREAEDSEHPEYYTDFTHIGSQTAVFGTDVYITNMETGSGDLVGLEPELLVIPWQEDWNDAESVTWGLGSFSVVAETESGSSVNWNYSFDNTWKDAKSYLKMGSEPWEYLLGLGSRKPEEITVNGHTWLRYYDKVGYNNAVSCIFLEDREGYGVLKCQLYFTPEDKSQEEADAFLADTELQERCVEILQFADEMPLETAAASPLAAKVISSDNGIWQAVLPASVLYEKELEQQYPAVEGSAAYTSWYRDSYSQPYQYWESDQETASYARSTKEDIYYSFRNTAYRDFSEDSLKTWRSSSDIKNLNAGPVRTYSLNGRAFQTRLLTYDYMLSGDQLACKELHVWTILDDDTAIWIEDRIENMSADAEFDEEATVRRLAGDRLQIAKT